MGFDLWIETEHLERLAKDFCNVLVTLRARHYASRLSSLG